MKVALAQINPVLGDFSENRQKIVEFTRQACERGAQLVVFPELALFGYQPMDLLERNRVYRAQFKQMVRLQKDIQKTLTTEMAVIVGAVLTAERGKAYQNGALFIEKKKVTVCAKQLLPSYDVFDETRHFVGGDLKSNVVRFQGQKILVTICEDNWGWPLPNRAPYARYSENPIRKFKKGQVDLFISMNGSPYSETKVKKREMLMNKSTSYLNCPGVYVNLVGGQDEQIYDGGSFALSRQGRILAKSPQFCEDLTVFDLTDVSKPATKKPKRLSELSRIESIRRALVLGIQDFYRKVGFSKAHLGLSGGIDSAVVACIAAEALGPENVTGLGLPGPFSAGESLELAQELSRRLGTPFFAVDIRRLYEASLKELADTFGEWEFGITHESLQSRLRALILMAYGGQNQSLLLSTSNKCELATGYATLYGDMCGALSPLGDLVKGDIYALAKLYNQDRERIPKGIMTRAPSAELRPGQKDQDNLPPYATLDRDIISLVECARPAQSEEQRSVLKMMYRSEFKRWQSPPILRVTDHGFGRGRRMPIAHRAQD